MSWNLEKSFETPDGTVRWSRSGQGDPVVLLHGSPFSSYIWREIAPALARTRTVYVWDLLGYGQSERRAGQDVSITAQARIFRRLLDHWGLERPGVVAHDIGGAVALRALLLEGADYRDLTLVDAVGGGPWGTGYFKLIREHTDVFGRLPDYAHEALVAAHLRRATHTGYRPEVLDAHLAPWRGEEGQDAFYRQYRHIGPAETAEFEHLLGSVEVPTRIIWGTEDRLLPPEFAHFLHDRVPHAELIWVDGAGHAIQEDAPGRLLAHVAAEFRQVAA
ncbi:alpha/beta fold hydrolase [Actinomycetota bacterium Odt1-20B]